MGEGREEQNRGNTKEGGREKWAEERKGGEGEGWGTAD